MDQHYDARTIYQRFSRRCEDRNRRLAALIDQWTDGPSAEVDLKRFNLEIHDWIGESKMLGLDKVTAAANELKDVLESWDSSFCAATQGAQLRAWIERLMEISVAFALEAPDNKIQRQLRELRRELQRELGISEFEEVPTGEIAALDQPTRRILVFDDSPIVCEVLSMELEARGHKVALAVEMDGFQERLTSFRPEVIFLDINMPEIQGDEVCRQLRQKFETNDTPIIFLSSMPDEELARLAKAAGANGFLSKQRGMDHLVSYLDDLLSQIIF
jgi:CheY-like chemotaxis protein